MTTEGRLTPPGAQPERTALAWQRTGLASAAGAAIVARHTLGPLGWWAAVLMAATMVLAFMAAALGRRRYLAGLPGSPDNDARPPGGRRRGRRGPRRDGAAPLALSASIVLLALTELAAITWR
ncbi:hypothetical protein GCM10022199_12670 [Marihabitans asiaticum]|uniref:Uncharacterized protein DUF202 n=1 Tax=Marihabitans asiaticum TaxID=415218 RepID=A0A560WI12_9MICO|nr:DUF202 domain-containing protein [Marihabitans asiaticum]TWD17279.1 uncharacterized protein DUF202 [Marihabitans asiaticum]